MSLGINGAGHSRRKTVFDRTLNMQLVKLGLEGNHKLSAKE